MFVRINNKLTWPHSSAINIHSHLLAYYCRRVVFLNKTALVPVALWPVGRERNIMPTKMTHKRETMGNWNGQFN